MLVGAAPPSPRLMWLIFIMGTERHLLNTIPQPGVDNCQYIMQSGYTVVQKDGVLCQKHLLYVVKDREGEIKQHDSQPLVRYRN